MVPLATYQEVLSGVTACMIMVSWSRLSWKHEIAQYIRVNIVAKHRAAVADPGGNGVAKTSLLLGVLDRSPDTGVCS